jgi:hypothetical protein
MRELQGVLTLEATVRGRPGRSIAVTRMRRPRRQAVASRRLSLGGGQGREHPRMALTAESHAATPGQSVAVWLAGHPARAAEVMARKAQEMGCFVLR